MPRLPRFFEYHFHPVGQGLFASGYLRPDHFSAPDFQWIYDCGTTSKAKYVRGGLRDVEALSYGRRRLDMLVLSHFDRDHVSGVCDLVRKYSVGTLVLPYMPLWQRLVIGFEEGAPPDGRFIGFFVSPATYLAGIPGADIERIVYVLPSEGGDGERPGVPPPKSYEPTGNDEPKWEPEIDRGRPEEPDPASEAPEDSGVAVEYLSPRGAIRIGGFWEFVPYNDAGYSKNAPANFRQAIRGLQQRLLNDAADRERALVEIKNLYDRCFGGSSRLRNIISLFLYGGPIYPSWQAAFLGLGSQAWEYGIYAGRSYRVHAEQTAKASVLYTGDGYLDTPYRLRNLLDHLGSFRQSHIGAFQVMHHGAEGNWHEGVARSVAPAFSVFSSDPGNKKLRHPHLPVLEEFQNYHPYQVDKQFGATAVGVLQPRIVAGVAAPPPDNALTEAPSVPVPDRSSERRAGREKKPREPKATVASGHS
jgi:hypothetical protein